MPTSEGYYTTYDLDNTNREDLLDVITMISPVETPLFSGVPKGTADATLHEWPVDELAAAAANTHIEGADAASWAASDRIRLANYCQIMTNPYAVTTTQERVKKAGVKSEKAYQGVKKMKEHKRDLEYAAFNNALAGAAGNATTARQMRGLKAYIVDTSCPFADFQDADHVIAPSAGANQKLTEEDVNVALELTWTQGGMVDTVLTSAKVKRRITGFVDTVPVTITSSGSTSQSIRSVDLQKEKRLTKRVDIYEGDFGEVRIIADRYIPTNTGTGGSTDCYFIEMARFSWDFLIKPFSEDLAKVGDSLRAWIYSQSCIAGKAPRGTFCYETVLNQT